MTPPLAQSIMTHPQNPWSADSSSACMIYPEQDRRPGRITSPLGDLRYINVRGSFPAMAGTLGESMSEAMRRGALEKIAAGLHTTIATSSFSGLNTLLSATSERLITRRLERHLPPQVMRALTQLADASSVPLRTVLDAHLMPETLLWLKQTLAQPPLNRTLPELIESSSLIIPHPTHPRLGLNFHYLGANTWERYTTLTSYHSPRAHSFVAVTTAGLIGAGHCAMNSAGLVLTIHPLHIHGLNLQGAPLGMCTDAIMRQASSIEQALDIIAASTFMTPLGLTLMEGDTGRVVVVERSPQTTHTHWFEPDHAPLSYNHEPLTHTLRLHAIDPAPCTRHAMKQRLARQRTLRAAMSSQPGIEDLFSYLSDMHSEASTQLPGMTAAQIAHPGVLASVVFDPASRQVWVAAGKSPTSRGWFVPFTLQPGRLMPCTTHTPHCVDPSWVQSPHGQALESYRQACYRIHEGESPKKLLLLLEHALALWPHDPGLHVACGLLAMRAKSLNRAIGSFERALELEQDATRRAEINLYMAMAIDLGPHTRGQAKTLYRKIETLAAAPSRVATFARKKRRRRLKHDEMLKLPLDLVSAGLHL